MTKTLTRTTTTEERRDLALAKADIQLRADADGKERFTGLAAVYNVRAAIGNPKTWGFFEEFSPGCATKTLSEFDQRKLIDHDTYYVVSRVSASTLRLAQSTRGIEVDSDLDDELSYVRDLKANLRNGNITGMSIGFRVPSGKDTWSSIEVEEEREDGKVEVYQAELRTIHEIILLEVSSVSFPAFVDTEAQLRHAVAPALARRGDLDAFTRRAALLPELLDHLQVIDREPDPSTRGSATDTEPAASTRCSRAAIDLRADALKARYPALRKAG